MNKTYAVSNGGRSKDLPCIPEEDYDPVASDEDSDGLKSPNSPPPKLLNSSGSADYSCSSSPGQNNSFADQSSLLSPKMAHLETRWGKSAKNWSLWTTWDSSFLPYPFLCGDVTKQNLRSMTNSKMDLKMVINSAFKTYRLEEKGWRPLRDNNFIVLQVKNQDIGGKYYPYTQEITLDTLQVLYKGETGGFAYPVNLQACAGLASVFKEALCPLDTLIISGGYDLLRCLDNSKVLFGLNYNKDRQTQIIRIPGNLTGRIILYENIEPLVEDKRFKFTYMVALGCFKRIVEQYRSYSHDEFCRKVTDTLAYDWNRFDFPVPIVRITNAHSIYDLLCSSKYNIPQPKVPSHFTDKATCAESWSPSLRPLKSEQKPVASHHYYNSGEYATSPRKRRSERLVREDVAVRNGKVHKVKSKHSRASHCPSVTSLIILTILGIALILGITWMQDVDPIDLTEKYFRSK